MFILAVLTLLVTLLIGWNIFTVVRFKDDVRRITEETVRKVIKDAIKENTLTKSEIDAIVNEVFKE